MWFNQTLQLSYDSSTVVHYPQTTKVGVNNPCFVEPGANPTLGHLLLSIDQLPILFLFGNNNKAFLTFFHMFSWIAMFARVRVAELFAIFEIYQQN